MEPDAPMLPPLEVADPVDEPVDDPVDEPVGDPVDEPVGDPVDEPVGDPVADPVPLVDGVDPPDPLDIPEPPPALLSSVPVTSTREFT